MPLTRHFKTTVAARLARDPKFRGELLREGVECFLSGDIETGKAILRDYVNATVGFEKLSGKTRVPAKSLMRMLGPKGNPQARNLFEVIKHLQRLERVRIEVSLKASRPPLRASGRPASPGRGKFRVPRNFNDALPDDIVRDFEGR